MSKSAKFFISSVICAGLAVIAYGAHTWHTQNLVMFVAYFILTMLSSGLKVSLPGIKATMSVWFLFILIGYTELSFGETLLLACGAALVQCFWHARKRPQPIQLVFNVAAVATASFAGMITYQWPGWESWGVRSPIPLGIAAIVFFLGNTGPVAMVVSLTENKSAFKLWRECYFWCFPYYLVGASIAALFSFLTHYFRWEVVLMTLPLIVVMFRSYTTYLGTLHAEKLHAEKMAALHLRSIEALALAIEAKDDTTHAHLERVKVYAVEIGKELGLSEDELAALEAAALLHDIGKLAVPDHIISKPGKLTPEEFEKMKIHPVVGAEILERVQFPYPVAPIVRAHHEKWDGSGYPYGLKGEDIPIGARILSAVDCLDALASHRQYRPALPLPEAMRFVVGLSGKEYDPKVVAILERRYVELENQARSHSESNAAHVLSTNIKIERGAAPAAGFEQGHVAGGSGKAGGGDFLTSIAAARQEAQEFFELTKDLGNSLALDETLWMISSRVKKMVPYDAICIFLADGQSLRAVFANGENSPALSSLNVPLGAGLSGWVAANRQPMLNGSPAVEPGYQSPAGGVRKLSSALAVPLEGLDSLVGVLVLYRLDSDAFSRDQLRILQAISQKVAAAIENARKYEKVKISATMDYLTSLPNSGSLFVHLDGEVNRCRRSNTPLAVLVCDLDGFKGVNDRFGHLTGNQLLVEVATGLKSACREYDYVARMGGDEFVVVLPGADSKILPAKILEFGRVTVAAGERVCGEPVVTLSIGHAVLGAQITDAEGLLAEADRQMYRIKRQRKPSRVLPSDVKMPQQGTLLVQ